MESRTKNVIHVCPNFLANTGEKWALTSSWLGAPTHRTATTRMAMVMGWCVHECVCVCVCVHACVSVSACMRDMFAIYDNNGKGTAYVFIERIIQSVGPQSALHFSPLAYLFIPTPTRLLWEGFSHVAITREDNSITFPLPSIARYSFIQLSELGHRGKKPKCRNC